MNENITPGFLPPNERCLHEILGKIETIMEELNVIKVDIETVKSDIKGIGGES